VLGPVRRNAWRQWEEVADIFQTPVDEHWAADRQVANLDATDP